MDVFLLVGRVDQSYLEKTVTTYRFRDTNLDGLGRISPLSGTQENDFSEKQYDLVYFHRKLSKESGPFFLWLADSITILWRKEPRLFDSGSSISTGSTVSLRSVAPRERFGERSRSHFCYSHRLSPERFRIYSYLLAD